MKTCGECKFCHIKEYGYSCYTVLGWTWKCMREKNPNFPVDDATAEDVHFAEECSGYIEGTPFKERIEE